MKFNFSKIINAARAMPQNTQLAYGAVTLGTILILLALILW